MENLPVIVGFGGINAAGRSSFHHMHNRLVIDRSSQVKAKETCLDLAVLMQLVKYQDNKYIDHLGNTITPREILTQYYATIKDYTLIRRIEKSHFDVDNVAFNIKATLAPDNGNPISCVMRKSQLPKHIPLGWQVQNIADDFVRVLVKDNIDLLLPDTRQLKVQSAAQLPTGFDPGALYSSTHHPRGLQMALYAASDAIRSIGISWQAIQDYVSPDKISVYVGNLMGQMDDCGSRGMMNGWRKGEELSSKQFSMSLVSMANDFVNSYVLNHLGTTSTLQGACATFLYNLEHAVHDIRSGKSRVAVVGSSEAPITPEIIEGLRVTGALAEDEELIALDKPLDGKVNNRRASRPFGNNCGFVIAESAQYVVLFDDRLAMELGAQIHGAVPSVYISADGNKKSITAPGIGNYITLGKAVASAQQLLGDDIVRHKTYVHAHGSSTPLNRTTESHVLNSVAKAFGIENWPVTSIKAYLGHSLASASGDQLAAALGVWDSGFIPGIFTLDKVADDVDQSHIELFKEHKEVGTDGMAATFINSKGFGGNNASALVLSPQMTEQLLDKRYSRDQKLAYKRSRENVVAEANEYNLAALKGLTRPIYQFGKDIVAGEDLEVTAESISVPGFAAPIKLRTENFFTDLSVSH